MPIADLPKFGCCQPCLDRRVFVGADRPVGIEAMQALHDTLRAWLVTVAWPSAEDTVDFYEYDAINGFVFLETQANVNLQIGQFVWNSTRLEMWKQEVCWTGSPNCVRETRNTTTETLCGDDQSIPFYAVPPVYTFTAADLLLSAGGSAQAIYSFEDPIAPPCCDFDP